MASSKPKGKSSARLVEAAQELLDAAGIEVSSKRQETISKDLVSLKGDVNEKLNTVNQNLVKQRTCADKNTTTIDQRLATLEQSLSNLTNEFSNQSRLQNIAFAIEQAKVNSFDYYQKTSESSYYNDDRKNSSDLVTNILMSFRRNTGWYLPDAAMQDLRGCRYNSDQTKQEKSKKNFRDRLINQIHALTGTKPRVTEESDGRSSIWYS